MIRTLVLIASMFAASLLALAQTLPPHQPGSICQTPKQWCWASPPGRPGAACSCPTPYGGIAGTLV